jgi:hypothetical protein
MKLLQRSNSNRNQIDGLLFEEKCKRRGKHKSAKINQL